MFAKSRSIIFFVLAIGLAMSSGCAPKPIQLTAADNGRQVTLDTGGEFSVALTGNPTTGYTWEAKDLDTAFLQQVGAAQFKGDRPGVPGAGGTLTLTFKALKSGTAPLTLVYHRSWETNVKPADTFTVTVFVK